MKHYKFKVFSSSIWIFLIFFVSACVMSCDQVTESQSVNISNTEQLTDRNSKTAKTQTERSEVQNKDNSYNSKNAGVSADDSIKQIDFKNFSYPWGSKIARLKDTITLKDGKAEIIKKDGKLVTTLPPHTQESYFRVDDIEYTIDDIYYGDVNSDNVTDAFISISTHTYSGKSYRGDTTCFYIYTIKENKPKLIWQNNYGEYKYTTARKIEFNKAQNEIIFEMYFPYSPNGKFVGQLYRETYSESYDRLIYKWNDNTFRLISTQNIPYTKLQIENLGVVGLDSSHPVN
jgi:hypothetical protein